MNKEELINLGIKCLNHVKRVYPSKYVEYIDRIYWPDIVKNCDPVNPDIWESAVKLYNANKTNKSSQIFYMAAVTLKTG